MEFYSKKEVLGTSIKCFNSQRDGILLKKRGLRNFDKMFQFPTGWNSTEDTRAVVATRVISFNSQRDGILHRSRSSTRACLFRVSIPNGMEFYAIPLYALGFRLPVSIPNGMEFYDIFTLSRHSARNVSIPNGMEFYNADFDFSFIFTLFQFPTGWNSTL